MSTILLNGCGQKESTKKYIPSNLLDLEVGKTSSIEQLEINLISTEKVNSYYDPYLKKVEKVMPGSTFVLVEAELKNIHSEDILAGAMGFYLKDNKGTLYDDVLPYDVEEGGLDIFAKLKPNEKIKGKFLFGIFEPIKDFKIQYDITSLT